ncbi:MAG: transketolase [Actinomycetota bacterium]
MTSRLDDALDSTAVNIIRGFALDAPLRAKSGHQGTALSLAPLGHVLYSRIMRHDPLDPTWPNRDRFILSAGHASILQYSLLYLQGYGLDLADIQAFRQWGSATPGHPENLHTSGVEVTTGPLGQGFANAVGMALAERHIRARFGTDICDHRTFVVLGDGCMMEGVSHEAASFAGHQRLDHLIAIFDDNGITIDGSTSLTCSDDVAMRFRSYGWEVTQLGDISDDLDALEDALNTACSSQSGRPQLLVLPTRIANPSPDWTGKHEAHGNPFTAEQVARTKSVMGVPDEPFWSPTEAVESIRAAARERGTALSSAWRINLSNHASRDEWNRLMSDPPKWSLPTFESGESIATRVAVQKALDACLASHPGLVSGSADLTGNTGTKLSGQTVMSSEDPDGRQIHYGIREHAMGALMVGMALHGGVIPVGGTFFVFLDYMKPAVRLAVLSGAKCVFVFSHDSVGVGEDGPTHQPIEQLPSLRSIPGLQVIRPADANETAQALAVALNSSGPTALVLSRQNVPVCTDGRAVHRGAGVVRASAGAPDAIIVATGSEVHVALAAAESLSELSIDTRVVSLASWDRFERFRSQDRKGADEILPPGVPTVSVEAASTFGWDRFADRCIGIDRFGASAPGSLVLENLGISAANVVDTVRNLLAERNR